MALVHFPRVTGSSYYTSTWNITSNNTITYSPPDPSKVITCMECLGTGERCEEHDLPMDHDDHDVDCEDYVIRCHQCGGRGSVYGQSAGN